MALADVKFIILDDDQLIYHSPLPPEDVTELQDVLRESKCFVPSFVDADPYSVETYVLEYAKHQTEITFLFDRNLYSRVLALAKGGRATERDRIAAAVMAFASCANTQIEPGLALYEGSASRANRTWKRDLGIFRRADEIHPVNWTALALGRIERFDRHIPAKRLSADIANIFDPNAKLRFYGFVYPIVLKMATIAMMGGSPDKKMIQLLDWMYYQWHFSAPATLLAIQALSHNPPKGVFKNIRAKNRAQSLAGVKNASWDLVYVTTWFEKIKAQEKDNQLTVLCSRDTVLLAVAELLRSAVFDGMLPPFESAGFGSSIIERYSVYISDLSNPKRALKPWPDDFEKYRGKLVSDLELEFLKPHQC